jgi:starch synthase
MAETSSMTASRRRVALLMWGDVVEDFLQPIGWSLEDMLARMTGGWFFGCIEALALEGIDAVPILLTRRHPGHDVALHQPTGARVRLIASPVPYRVLRAMVPSPYDALWQGAHTLSGVAGPLRPLHAFARDLLPYLATPPRALARVIAEEQCDVILCQEYEEPRFDIAVDCGARLGIPVFAIYQGAVGHRSRHEARRRPASMAAARGFIIGSARERERVREAYAVPAGRIATIFNPLDERLWFPERDAATRQALGIPVDAVVVAWHGRVDVSLKGLDVILDAWRLLDRTSPARPHLLLIGAGQDDAELRRRIAESGDDITWVDHYVADRPTMRRYLSCADAWVMASRREGFPMAPLEAMACGVPVVASDVNGVSDILPRGERDGGLTFPIGDAPALARHLTSLLEDAPRRVAMGANALRRVREAFTPAVVGRQLADFLFAAEQ